MSQGPMIVKQAGDVLLVTEWEAFAQLAMRYVSQPGKSAPEPVVCIAIEGRVNKTDRKEVRAYWMAPEAALDFAAGIVHAATHTDGKPIPLDQEEDVPPPRHPTALMHAIRAVLDDPLMDDAAVVRGIEALLRVTS